MNEQPKKLHCFRKNKKKIDIPALKKTTKPFISFSNNYNIYLFIIQILKFCHPLFVYVKTKQN